MATKKSMGQRYLEYFSIMGVRREKLTRDERLDIFKMLKRMR